MQPLMATFHHGSVKTGWWALATEHCPGISVDLASWARCAARPTARRVTNFGTSRHSSTSGT